MKNSVVSAIFTLFCFATAINAAANINFEFQDLKNRIVYFSASSPYRGKFMCADLVQLNYGGKLPFVTLKVAKEEEVENDNCFKWRVNDVEDSHITLESVRYRNMYISAINRVDEESRKSVILKESGYPIESGLLRLKIQDYKYSAITGQLKEVVFVFYDNIKYMFGTNSQNHGAYAFNIVDEDERRPYFWWFVYIPETSDEYTLVDSVDNSDNNEAAQWSYTRTVGLSKTNGESISDSMEATLSFEIGTSFAKASSSLKYAETWARQSSKTFSKSTSKTVSTTVAAGSKLEVWRLTGFYGKSFEVGADHFRFVNPDNGEIFDSVDDFNRRARQISKVPVADSSHKLQN